MKKKLLLLDGAVGTSLWAKADNKVPVWRYNLENPAIVTELHKEYIDAGSDIIQSNTFSANRPSVAKTKYSVEDIMRNGVRLAKEAVVGTDVKVALSIGPLTELLEPYGDLEPDEAQEIYEEQIGSGMAEKPDYIFLETFIDLEMIKIAAGVANKYDVPLICSMSFDKTGHTIMGNSVKDFIEALSSYKLAAIGLNCSLGPDLAVPVLTQFRENTDMPLFFKPNAGKTTVKDGKEVSEFDVDTFVNDIMPALEYDISYLGGCCGSDPTYIAKLKEKIFD